MARLATVPDHPGTNEPPILDAAQEWKRKCLLSDGSILSDSRLWTAYCPAYMPGTSDQAANSEWALDSFGDWYATRWR
jgi:hypothetical protein